MPAWGGRCAGVCVMMVCVAGSGDHGRWWKVGSYPRTVPDGGRAEEGGECRPGSIGAPGFAS